MERKYMFFSLLNEEIAEDGFVFVKSKNGFVKKENGNEYWFRFNLRSPFFSVETDYRLIIGEIEKIKKNAFGKGYYKLCTVGNTQSGTEGYLGEGTFFTYTDELLVEAAKKVLQFYYSYTKDYYQRHLDFKYLDKILNENPGEVWCLAYNAIDTSFLAIIVAKLTLNPNLENLFDFYRGLVDRHNMNIPNRVEEYDVLVNYLKKLP